MNNIRGVLGGIIWWMGEKLIDLATSIYGYEKENPKELENFSMLMDNNAKNFIYHRCSNCNGRGYIELPSGDTAICEICKGTRLDIRFLAENSK